MLSSDILWEDYDSLAIVDGRRHFQKRKLNQFAFPREDERGSQDGTWLVEVIERAPAQLASVRFDSPLQP
jgi:hypothetical protein